MDNCLTLGGRIVKINKTRHSPAGIPIAQLVIEHHSRQIEAGIEREARCRIQVLACGETLVRDISALAIGSPVRVIGFICRANYRHGETRLVLHAERIELEKD